MFIIDGKAIADKVKDELVGFLYPLVKDGKNPRPNLAIILVGNRDDSKIYVSLKEEEARLVGIDTNLYRFSETASEEEIIETVEFLNNDPNIDAILIQLPLPEHLNTDKIISILDPLKDADGFKDDRPNYVESPVIASTLRTLEEILFIPKDKKAFVLYNSEIFGQTMIKALQSNGLHAEGISLRGLASLKEDARGRLFKKAQQGCLQADLIVSALGCPSLIDNTFVKSGTVIIDIGITKDGKKVLGDVDQESLSKLDVWLTPVPGGIGPMTIAMLFKNVLAIYRQRHNL